MSIPNKAFRISPVLALLPMVIQTHVSAAGSGEFEINVVDSISQEPIAVRMQLRNERSRFLKPKGFISHGDSFVFDGRAILKLPTGQYHFRMERGPEYRVRTGHFRIDRGAADHQTVKMIRFANMAEEGWYSGDLSVAKPLKDIPLFMLAEDLRVALVPRTDKTKPTGVSSVGRSRFYSTVQEFKDPVIGSVSFANVSDAKITLPSGNYPWSFLTQSNDRDRTRRNIDLGQTSHWDLPVWLASKRVDTVRVLRAGVANRPNHERNTVVAGRPPDPTVYGPPDGDGRWLLDIYFRLLDAGFRIPPTAASQSGISSLPVGLNRVYVYCGRDFSYENWWQHLRAGKCVLTNGPLIRPYVAGHPPGHVFRGYAGQTLELEMELKLSTREKISYLEIIKNGQCFHEVRLADFLKVKGQLPTLKFTDSGWFLVRAICDDATTYKYACSAPFFVDFEDQNRISRRACKFFLDWSQERLRQIEKTKKSGQKSLPPFHQGAVNFWQARFQKANVD